ncbi:unnamed protein product [Cuscuta campestris]|uniref:Dynamin-type G domain-containing protein n=1 Tax=Cuscuta campestris TaxID=132261 RepID=A0A484L2E4_9ASTE|nr:unnamed protein product [Cuscuta campestris]
MSGGHGVVSCGQSIPEGSRCGEAASMFLRPGMDGLIALVNRIQKACTVLGDYGDDRTLPTLWDALPTIVVLGGQSSGKSSALESIVGRDFLPRGSGIVTRRPLILQLYKTEQGQQDYAQFLHSGNKKYTEFSLVTKEIKEETDRVTGKPNHISPLPINLSIYSPNVVNLTLVDLPGLTNVAVEGQPESIVHEIENMVRSYVEKPNCIILAITPANQDVATSDAIKIAREVDPTGDRTIGVLTKLDLMDKGTNALDVLEGRSYRLQHPWVGVVNRSQADINRNVDMIVARRKEREFFAKSPDYKHLASRMGSEYLAKMLSQRLESVIKAHLPAILSLINTSADELETELNHLGRPVAIDAGVRMRPGGDRIYEVFDYQLPAALRKLPLDRHLSLQNIRNVVSVADGYQPHLIAPEQGYRRLIDGAINYFRGPAQASVDAVHFILKELVRKSIGETQELRRFPTLQTEIANAAGEALERFREDSKRTVVRLVDMESSYLTVDFFRKLPQEDDKAGSSTLSAADTHTEEHFKRIRSNVSAYTRMVCETLQQSIPKAVVYCQRLESVIKAHLPAILSLINTSADELETELNHLGRPVAIDAGAHLYTILELCRAFDRVFKEHLEGGRPGGDRIYEVFDYQLPAALRKLPLDRHLSLQNIRNVVSVADGYQPHLIAPEQGYRRLIDGAINYFRGPAQASVDAVHFILKELVRKSIGETQELRRFPTLQTEIANAAGEALERFRDDSKRTVVRLVDMESSYLTVDFFRKLPQEDDKAGSSTLSAADTHTEEHFKRIRSNVSAYTRMVCETLQQSIPKAVVYCQVREAKRSLLDHFYAQLGGREDEELYQMLDEDRALVERRQKCSRRLELYRCARDEIDSLLLAR